VFSPEDVNFLEQFNPAAYKIVSMEFTDTNLTGAGKTAASVGVKIRTDIRRSGDAML
jgi:sialic acid synthase SpsE